MKAWVLSDIGQIEYADVPKPVPGPGEALIRVRAAGICGSDVPRVYKTGAHRMPLIPGHEFSGVVESGADGSSFSPGDRVGIFPLIPCYECEPCRKGFYEMCRHYDYVGSRRDGAFAEYVTVPVNNLIRLPDEVSFEEAAMLEPMAVAVHSIRRTQLLGRSDERPTICILGLGTIGLLVADFLMEAGYTDIYTVGHKSKQRELFAKLAKKHEVYKAEDAKLFNIVGSTYDEMSTDERTEQWASRHYIDSRDIDAIKWLQDNTHGLGVDFFFECVGTNECINMAIEGTAPAGHVVMVGNPASDITFSRDTYWKILRNQIRITGTWNSSFAYQGTESESEAAGDGIMDDWRYVLDRLKEKTISPASLITHRLPLEGLEEGLIIMRDKTEDYCKIMLTIGD